MTTPVIDPGPPPAPPASDPQAPPRPSTSDRFFSWTAGLGLVRGDGWIGGVAAGIAARLRIDPLIVRGILVVAALFGLPLLFLYAVAWAVLPDLDGRIPLQEAFRSRFTPALVGIAAFAILGLVPWSIVSAVTGGPWSGGAGALLTAGFVVLILAVGCLVYLIVRAALHAPPSPDPVVPTADQRTASAASAAPDPSAAAPGSGPDVARADRQGVDAAGFAASAPALSLSGERDLDTGVAGPALTDPAHPDPDAPEPASAGVMPDDSAIADDAQPGAATEDAYAAWREQHAAWKVQDDAWRRQQQDAARIAREQARRERQERGAAFSAEAAERRRIRQATNPRTPFAAVALVVGIAVVAGALVAVTSGAELAISLGLFVAALVTALGMVVAGALRRRSGFLAFLTVLLLAGGAAATATPTLQSLHVGDYSISNAPGAQTWPASRPFVQPWGSVYVSVIDTGEPTSPIHIDKRSGWTTVDVDSGVQLDVDITVPPGYLSATDGDGQPIDLGGLDKTSAADGSVRYRGTIVSGGKEPATRQSLVVTQQSGGVQIMSTALPEDEQ
jgi:phage shock protein PspC (stress-responsive transcriptional regulator)